MLSICSHVSLSMHRMSQNDGSCIGCRPLQFVESAITSLLMQNVLVLLNIALNYHTRTHSRMHTYCYSMIHFCGNNVYSMIDTCSFWSTHKCITRECPVTIVLLYMIIQECVCVCSYFIYTLCSVFVCMNHCELCVSCCNCNFQRRHPPPMCTCSYMPIFS